MRAHYWHEPKRARPFANPPSTTESFRIVYRSITSRTYPSTTPLTNSKIVPELRSKHLTIFLFSTMRTRWRNSSEGMRLYPLKFRIWNVHEGLRYVIERGIIYDLKETSIWLFRLWRGGEKLGNWTLSRRLVRREDISFLQNCCDLLAFITASMLKASERVVFGFVVRR